MLSLSTAAAQKRKSFFIFSLLATLVLMTLALVPSVKPGWLPFLHPLTIDTDPENMLSEEAPVPVRHDKLKKVFEIYDFVVVGVVNESHKQRVFNPKDLENIKAVTDKAKTLSYDIRVDNEVTKQRVIAQDIIAPSTVDNIETKTPGTVSFQWLMRTPPETSDFRTTAGTGRSKT